MDALSIVADEVALEGLDGITIPTLWIRLEDRQPKFPLKLDECTKGFIWRSLVNDTELRFYELPKEREDVELLDRFKDVDPETGIETKETSSEDLKDVYPVHVIPETKDGTQGSCAFFKERKDVTKHIRSKSLTPLIDIEEALEKYGRKLVVVASQAVRFRALIGIESDPDLKLSNDSYCVLERVARARWQGELQRDLHGGLFKADARKFHYFRKSLVKHELITMQPYVRRPKTGQQQHSILLLLKRFHVNRRTMYDMLMEYVSNFLQQSPYQFVTVDMLKEHLNLNDGTFKRLFKYLRAAKLTEFCQYPLEDLDPSAGPCTNKNGSKVLVRCVKLLKPYTKKGVTEDDDDDEDEEEEDYSGARRRADPSEGRLMERNIMMQAYHIILSSGTKGIPQRAISVKMNIGKLESRMIWRKLERDGFIKAFMEDEGRQRTTKFISHRCVGVSDQLQLFAKEQERKKLLYSSAPEIPDADPATFKTLSSSKSPANKKGKTPAAKRSNKAGVDENKNAEEEKEEMCDDGGGDEGLSGRKGKAKGKSGAGRKTSAEKHTVTTNQTQPGIPVLQPPAVECETPACSGSVTSMEPDSVPLPAPDQASVKEQEQSNSGHASPLPQSEGLNTADNSADNNVMVVDSVFQPQRFHETYRLLKRKNLIVEAVQKFKIIEGLFPLQKMISDEEKQDGFSSKCCKKTISRLVQTLSKEGLLKMYTTTVIQDGITKKVDMVVHPSIQPNDDRVSQLIEQVRFKISSSYSAVRQQQADEKAREQKMSDILNNSLSPRSKGCRKGGSGEDDIDFKPTPVRGLGKTLGFQPKMHRLRLIHNFLWYLIYGHPVGHHSTDSASQMPTDPNSSSRDAKHPDAQAKQNTKDKESSSVSNLDETSGNEEEPLNDQSKPGQSEFDMKVYVDEESWKRFIPSVRVHKDFISGWAMVGDVLLCLPLSIFVQFTQINYKVDGLEEYLSDPVKQHCLVRALPARMKRHLLYKRKYIHSFHENLQRLAYMGLLQFGLVEKFKEKDQVFVYLKRNATIVDTTNTEPHYWLVTESPDKPFERRQYTFSTAEDVESYWFDLMCVCLNTPLGVIRNKRNVAEDEAPSFVHERSVFVGMAYLLKGSFDVCDDGSIPGDGKGAGGLDSEFFCHLKRNWYWTNHLLACKTKPSGSEEPQIKMRLKSLVSKNALRIALQAGENNSRRYLTNKRPLMTENVEVDVEPASRNQQVVGGKGQKRKRSKKEVVKGSRKKRKEPKKRTPAHDEADHQALKMMTKQRVYWSVQEDSLMMLSSVASYLLNSKLKRPFIPHCVVRDLLHAEFEISVDKTSLAVGRRSRYILKNPQALLNYRICLAEVYQDKTMMRLLEEKKPSDPDKPEDCAKTFSEYVKLLRQKFSSVMNARNVIMPDSKQQLFSRYKVSAIDDGRRVPCKDTLNSTDDIHGIVLHNLIQSTLAMTNSQMKSSRSFQTFHTYSKYDQELLCKVFIQCRKRRLVNRRRINQSFGPKKNRALPILPMSYQLSQSYYRKFSWRFPQSLCTDSFCFLKSLITNGTGDERPVITLHHETEVRSQNGEEVLERKTEASRKEKKSGRKEGGREVDEPQIQPEVAHVDSTKEGENVQSKMEGEEKLMEKDANNEKTEDISVAEQHKNPEYSLPSESNEASSNKEPAEDQLPKEQTEDQLPKEPAEDQPPKEPAEDQPPKEQTEDQLPKEPAEDQPPKEPAEDQLPKEPAEDQLPKEQTEDQLPKEPAEDQPPKEQTEDQLPKEPAEDQPPKEPAEDLLPKEQTEDQPPKEPAEDQPPKEPAEVSAASDAAPQASADPPDVSDMLRFSLSYPGGACVASLSLMTLGLLNVHVSIPKQIVVVDSSLVDNDVAKSMAALEEDDDDDEGEECEGRKRLLVTSHQASHTNYLIMRGYSSPGIVQMRNLSNNDNIVVESCIMRLQLRDTPAHHLFSEENCPPLDLTKCGPSLLPSMLTRYIRSPFVCLPSVDECDRLLTQQRQYTAQDIDVCARLRGSLDEAGENGLDEQDLRVAHLRLLEPQSGHTNTLQQYLQALQEEGQVVRVGSLGVRWVLMRHAEPWLLTVKSQQSSRSHVTSEKSPFLKSRHNIPFMRKRSSRELNRETEGPPPKKLSVDRGEGADVEIVDEWNNLKEKPNEEEQQEEHKGRANEQSGDKLLNLGEEEKVQTQPEEERGGEVGQVEGEKRQDQKMELRARKSSLDNERHAEACAPPTGSADEGESMSFISRPWRLVDGKLNRPVCKGMLEAILYHIMSRPGLTQQTLVEHYKDVLQPVAVLDLMQALTDLGCVTKKTLIKEPKPSLFARSEHQTRSETNVTVEEPDTVFYEPTISCCLRLCQVLPNERHWNDSLS
ncbi:general transcription factor 3C polypeptide 1 isoform X2 [Leuresthes tenuis]|uniref:general transcription factor 3C polypeptide 1 isoform X2 n=1 Tax=Leuresthes tenuis TaxID=355514 RepID=UPI003B507A8E